MRLTAVLFCAFVVLSQCCVWVPLDWRTLEKALPDDSVQVRYLTAPLLWCTVGNVLSELNAYHGGIATINSRTGQTYTFNMGATPTFEGAFFPKIDKLKNGTANLTMTNYAGVLIYDGINKDYWHTHNDHIADMTGAQFNQFVAWISKANTTYPRYNAFSVFKQFPAVPLLPGYECFEFAFDCIRTIVSFGGQMVPGVTSLERSDGVLYTDNFPLQVDPTDPNSEKAKDVVDFFEALESGWESLGVLGFFEEMWRIATLGEFYFLHGSAFYYVPLKFPFIEMHFVKMPIFNTTRRMMN